MDIKKRISEVMAREADAIASIVITDQFEEAMLALKGCSGKIVTTGMGKAGLAARKFASTLCSTGTPAGFLHSGESAHGDLGFIGPDDCVVVFSTSGKTREVIEMIGLARHLGLATVIGITSHPDSELRSCADIILDMGIVDEPCPLGLTPTASIAVMLAIGDALALTLMELKGITRKDYGLRHHGGYLGKKARE